MTLREILASEGLYRADSFAKGVAFKVRKNSITGTRELWLVIYSNVNDLFPEEVTPPLYEEMFEKDYKKVFTIKSLFE